MQRRDLLRLLMSAGALSAVPMDLMVTLQQARAQVSPAMGLRTLNSHQDATISTLSELIIPETDTPGAKGAKVNEFIDLLLTEWFGEADTGLFLQGLAGIDEESRNKFGSDFIGCTAAQQTELMTRFDKGAMEFVRARKAAKAPTTSQPLDFFYTFKRLTLVGYYTSEIGFKQELGRTIIPPSHQGCAPAPEVRS